MANYEIPQNPQYDEEIRKLETGDPAHADVFNSIFGRIIRNVAFLKRDSVSRGDLGIPDGVTPSVESQVPVIPAPAATRENIADGDNMGTILSKIKRWFADLKNVAFTGSYNDLSNKPSAMKNPKALKINGKTYDGSAEIDAGTLGVAYGGTGAADAAGARTNLGAAAASHNHSAANITSGTLPIARGGTGAADAGTARSNLGAAAANHTHPTANNLTTTAAGYILDARQGPVIQEKLNQINSDLGDKIKIASQTIQIDTVPANGAFGNNYPLDVILDGYTCVGITTYDCNYSYAAFSRAGANRDIIYFTACNLRNTAATNVTVTMRLLYVKD